MEPRDSAQIERFAQVEQATNDNAECIRDLRTEFQEFAATVRPGLARIGKIETNHIFAIIGSVVVSISAAAAVFVEPLRVTEAALQADLEEHKSPRNHVDSRERITQVQQEYISLAADLEQLKEGVVNHHSADGHPGQLIESAKNQSRLNDVERRLKDMEIAQYRSSHAINEKINALALQLERLASKLKLPFEAPGVGRTVVPAPGYDPNGGR